MKWIARILLAAFVCSLLGGGEALAQNDPVGKIARDIKNKLDQQAQQTKSAMTGQPAQPSTDALMSALAKPFQDLADFVNSDAAGAATLATQVPGLQDTNGKACWLKMQDAGAVFKAHPVPVTLKIMTDFEALRLLNMTANNLCSYSPCTVVFADAANLATSVASAVGGVTTSALQIPSLTTLCSRIPQLAPMLPAAVTGLAPTPVATPSPTPSPAPTAPQ